MGPAPTPGLEGVEILGAFSPPALPTMVGSHLQGSRPSCPGQEGRKGSEEGVPETSVFLSRETGISGNFVGRIKGAKCPFDLQFLTWDFS